MTISPLPSARPCASRTRCRRALTVLRGDSPDPRHRRAGARGPVRSCSCSTRSCMAPTPTTAASAPKAIVRALVMRGAIGLVTTHDLALTELVTSPQRARGERPLRGSARGWEDGVRLSDARGRRRAQQRAGADARHRPGRLTAGETQGGRRKGGGRKGEGRGGQGRGGARGGVGLQADECPAMIEQPSEQPGIPRPDPM